MNKIKYKWFYQSDFLDEVSHDQLLYSISTEFEDGLLIASDGTITKNDTKILSNRYHNNDILKDNVSISVRKFIELNEKKLFENGVKVPVLFNFGVLVDPRPKPGMRAFGWHKDYNIIEHTQDPLKLWFTIYTLTNQDVDSEFTVSPTPDGPEFWNMGVRTKATTNKLFGHNMNLGHEYLPKEKNRVFIVYMRWFDAA